MSDEYRGRLFVDGAIQVIVYATSESMLRSEMRHYHTMYEGEGYIEVEMHSKEGQKWKPLTGKNGSGCTRGCETLGASTPTNLPA